MFNNSLIKKAMFALILVALSAFTVFADTIKLKDGSVIKGRITSFSNGRFTITIGEGARMRQISYFADEIESIEFDSAPAAATTSTAQPKPGDEPKKPNVVTEGNTTVITVGSSGVKTIPATPSGTPATNPKITSDKTVVNTPVKDSTAVTRIGADAIKLNVKVLADDTSNGWTSAGFVVKKGQVVKVSADGRVSLGNGRFATPIGISSLPDAEKLMAKVATGALIAVIGDDNNDFIYIGIEKEFVADRDGMLFLGVNEGNLQDNSGAFEVTLMINPN